MANVEAESQVVVLERCSSEGNVKDGRSLGDKDVSDSDSSKHCQNNDWQFNAKHWLDIGDDEAAKEKFVEDLFNKTRVMQGSEFGEVIRLKYTVHGRDLPQVAESFRDLDLDPTLFDNILTYMKYENLTPVQKCVIPAIMSGRDLVACSHTGTGKTASFMIPIVNMLIKAGREACADEPSANIANGIRVVHPRALILSPTRELAIQIFSEARKFSHGTWIRPFVVYGGVKISSVITHLHNGAHILCATIGRLMEMLDMQKISLSKVRFVVLDEADRLLSDVHFADEVQRILCQYDLPSDESKQISVYSATFPKLIRSLAINLLIDPLLITVENVTALPKSLEHKVMFVEDNEKFNTLLDTLYAQEAGQTLIFVNSASLVDALDDALYRRKFPVTSIHGKRTQAEREDAISAFRSNKTPIMIATSLASRGLDIPNIIHVINYDMPDDLEEYVHRVGRTARVGNKGLATTFYNNGSEKMATTLATLLRTYKQDIPDFLEPYLPAEDDKNGGQAPDVLDERDADAAPMSTGFSMLLNKLGNTGGTNHDGGDGGEAEEAAVSDVDADSPW